HPEDAQEKDRDAERSMERDQPVVVAERGHHGHADEEHGQQHGGHQPVQEARSQGELRRGRGGAHRAASPGDTALGVLGSPSRRVNDSEYTAERALSSGSSDGAIPFGRIRGSKLMSRAGLVSSLSIRSNVSVPASSVRRSAGQGIRASYAGAPCFV